MAITAWLAKLWTNSICLSVNGRTFPVQRDHADRHAVTQQRYTQHAALSAAFSGTPIACVSTVGKNVRNGEWWNGRARRGLRVSRDRREADSAQAT